MTGTDTYIFAGGGSGGHLFPGIAVADELRRENPACRIVFVGSERPVERSILGPTGFEHHALPVESLRELRRSPVRFFRRNWAAIRQARQILKAAQPRWVIGLGGFASAPTVWTAWRMDIPVLLIEQNVIPGAATRWLAGCAKHICLSFEGTRGRLQRGLPTIVTGNPVRETIRIGERRGVSPTCFPCDDVEEHVGLTPRRSPSQTLLILGGSQGAESLNNAVAALLPELRGTLSGWRIVHQTGAGRSAAIRNAYQSRVCRVFEANHSSTAETVRLEDSANPTVIVEDFFPNIAEWYAQADLVISRAGATTLAELACVGCPMVLVPYPFAADQHQAANAEAFAQAGAAVLVNQAATTDETVSRLREPLLHLITDPSRRAAMSHAALRLARPDAARDIAALLLNPGSSSNRDSLSDVDHKSKSRLTKLNRDFDSSASMTSPSPPAPLPPGERGDGTPSPHITLRNLSRETH